MEAGRRAPPRACGMTLLDDILREKRQSLAGLAEAVTRTPAYADAPRPLAPHLRRHGGAPLGLCLEHKRRSPSAGPLDTTLGLAARVRAYADAGAKLVSVLTDTPFFGGTYGDLLEARVALEGTPTRVLAKEFVVDPVQIRAAKHFGADAVLLVVRLVEAPLLGELVACARELGLGALVEVTTEDELEIALSFGADVVGVNARDLDTLVMDPARARRVLEAIPAEVVKAHLSGLKLPDDVARVARTSADAALIGESVMREADPRPLLRAFAEAALVR